METSPAGFPPLGRSLPGGTGAPQAHGCPVCAHPLERVSECEAVHWLCTSCGQCWVVRSGRLAAVNAVACSGCAEQSKEACFEVLRARLPSFGPPDLEL